jgi:multiple sugar transport system permease protein
MLGFKKATLKKKLDLFPYLLISPTVILTLAIMLFPILTIFSLSTQNYSMNHISQRAFIGLTNFKNIFTSDTLFRTSTLISLKWVLIEVLLQVVLGLAIALLLNQTFRGRGVVRAIIFSPWAVSGVLTTMLWILMYNESIGVINDILKKLHIISTNIAWLGNPSTVFGAVVVAELWRGLPFFAITLLAALQSVPMDIYESCAIDGCGKIRRLFFITLPFLKDTIILTTLLRCIWEFNSMDMIFTMTNGGPMNLTTTLSIYLMQTSIVQNNYGYGAALAVIVFLGLLIFSIFYMNISKYGENSNE